jgi:hypothetical protein
VKWLISGVLGWPKSAALSFPLRGLPINHVCAMSLVEQGLKSEILLFLLSVGFVAAMGFVLWALAVAQL